MEQKFSNNSLDLETLREFWDSPWGTDSWGIAAVIPKYLSLRLQPERFVPLYPRKLAFTINLMLKTTKNILNLENFP